MPEGDTLHAAAATLQRALSGATVTGVAGSHPAVRARGRRLVNRRIERVEAQGKHLLMHFDGAWSLRTHLGMPGSWHLYRPGERWRITEGKARVVLDTDEWQVVCFAAPTVQIGPTAEVLDRVGHLGPDLLSDDFAMDDYLARAAALDPATPVGDLLLNQRVLAGVGNVYKSEVLFLERLHPLHRIGDLGEAKLRALADRSRRLLVANRGGGRRVTTGDRRPGRESWVYGRDRKPCRRCGTEIAAAETGTPPRITYWCPNCQPEAGGPTPP